MRDNSATSRLSPVIAFSEELGRAHRARLAGHADHDQLRASKTPDHIAFWDELPRTETGKLVRECGRAAAPGPRVLPPGHRAPGRRGCRARRRCAPGRWSSPENGQHAFEIEDPEDEIGCFTFIDRSLHFGVWWLPYRIKGEQMSPSSIVERPPSARP